METRKDPAKTVTMATIARLTGVSQGAISSLLNDRDYGIRVSAATREKVFAVCRKVGYIPNDLRALVRMYPDRGDLAVLWQKDARRFLDSAYGTRFFRGIRAAVPNAQYTSAEFSDAVSSTLPKTITDGIATRVITVGQMDSILTSRLAQREARHVAVENTAAQGSAQILIPDYAEAARLALQHLRDLGHQNIAVISSGCAGFESRQTLLDAGVKKTANGLKLSIDRTIASPAYWSYDDGLEILQRVRSSPLGVTALFCYRDEIALGVLAALRKSGKSASAEFSVIGCDDDPDSAVVEPGLTTIRIPVEDLASRAAELVAQPASTDGMPLDPLPVTLIERGSTTPNR